MSQEQRWDPKNWFGPPRIIRISQLRIENDKQFHLPDSQFIKIDACGIDRRRREKTEILTNIQKLPFFYHLDNQIKQNRPIYPIRSRVESIGSTAYGPELGRTTSMKNFRTQTKYFFNFEQLELEQKLRTFQTQTSNSNAFINICI